MAWYTVRVVMVADYSVEAETAEEAERDVDKELPQDVSVVAKSSELEDYI